MHRTTTLLTAAGLGAGMMYMLDPQKGRRRRAAIRDKMIRARHQLEQARDVVSRDMRNRLSGLAAGDCSVLIGGKNALRGNPLRGNWSPSGRAMLGLIGGGLFLAGLMRQAPTACILGTVGIGLMIEGATNAGIEDIASLPTKMAETTSQVKENIVANFDHVQQKPRRKQKMTQA